MGILSGLKHLGLDNLENVDIYEANKEEAKRKELAAAPRLEEKDLIYDKTFTCPVCGRTFTSKIMKSSKTRLLASDPDLRPKYDGIDAIKYDVVLCTWCGYAGLTNMFTRITPGQIKVVKEEICSKVRMKSYQDEIYSYEQVLERYQLALASAVVKRSKASEKAYICLKAGWVLRGYAESLKVTEEMENSRWFQKRIADLEKEELEYLEYAYKGFMDARQTEGYPMCGMDEITLDYLLAALSMRFQRYEVAARLIGNILTSSSASSRVKDKARNMKDQILKELRKRQK